MATLKQIAELTNLSRGTIDRVINNRGGVSPETEKKVRLAMQTLNYTPSKAGKILASLKKKLKFGFILFATDYPDSFFSEVENGIRTKAAELQEFGVSVDIRFSPSNNEEMQIELLDHFASNGYDGIAISPINKPGIEKKISEISGRNIPVVTINTDLQNSGRLTYVGSNYFQCGQIAANLIGIIAGARARVGIIDGSGNLKCITERCNSFQNYIIQNYPDIEIVSTIRNRYCDPVENYLLVKKMLDDFPEMDSLYLAVPGVDSACRAVVESGRKIIVISNDCAPSTKRLMNEGVVTATIDQNPFYQGCKPLEILYDVATIGADGISDHYYTNAAIKIRSNI